MNVDFDAVTRKLRTLAWRAAGLTLLWCLVFVGAGRGMDALDAKAQRLLDHGIRTTATVIGVHRPLKSGWSIDVRYVGHTAEITLDSHRYWAIGQSLTVFYDPADPDTVRTSDDRNENQFLLGVCVIPFLFSLAGIPFSAAAVARWWRRYRAAKRTGWQEGSAVVHTVRKQRSHLILRLPKVGGWKSEVILSTHGVARTWHEQRHKIWLAGDRRAMTVLFERRGLPYVVLVKKSERISGRHAAG